MRGLLNKIEWRLFLSVLGVVFISEMGDKTQITTMLLASAKPAQVFWVGLGSALALICTSLVEVLIGSEVLARYLKPATIQIVSALAFIVLGSLLLLGVIGNVKAA
ncbi:MAG: TMEM165/GDT1 family protein [Solirubrobacterales bacterium]